MWVLRSGQILTKSTQRNHPDRSLDAAYGQILMWRDEVELNLDPEMPAGLRNRFADSWRPLISIADSLGWGEKAREAMLVFAREYRDADVKILLLSDIRKIFETARVDCLSTKALLSALHALDEADWCEFRGVRGDQQPHRLRDTELGAMLRGDFKIRSHTLWPTNRTAETKSAKGYRQSDFEDAWRKYCADHGTASQESNVKDLRVAGDRHA